MIFCGKDDDSICELTVYTPHSPLKAYGGLIETVQGIGCRLEAHR